MEIRERKQNKNKWYAYAFHTFWHRIIYASQGMFPNYGAEKCEIAV